MGLGPCPTVGANCRCFID
uniref:Uncharacterized protein n=1 Tax=Arundo donax TaxID=35708 RepID=A0A0A8YSY4_ARUDO